MIMAASYCRVSTDKMDQVNSFEAQQRYFREYISRQPEWELYAVYADEGITGTTTKKRTEFNRMISDAYDGKFQMIITKEVSRFSRNILDTISYTRELKAIGVGVLFVMDGINTLDPDAELHLSIMASMAQEESRKTSSRVVWGQTRQMERGVVFGRSMLGYDVKAGKMSINPEGAEIVRLIFCKYALEQIGTSEIARFLTAQGYRTYTGSTNWKPNTIVKILHNEKYTGDLIQKKTYTPDFLTHEKRRNTGQVPMICIENHHEPIISREIWDLAQKRLRKNQKHKEGERNCSDRYLFSGKIRCGECGAGFVGRNKYLKDGTRIRRWSCGRTVYEGTHGCAVGKLIRDDDALQMLKTAIRSLQIDVNQIISNVTRIAIASLPCEEQSAEVDPKRLRYEIRCIRQKKAILMDSYFSGVITQEDMQLMKSRYDQQLDKLNHRLNEQHIRQDRKQLQSEIQAKLISVLNGERDSTIFCKTVLEKLTVFKDRHIELKLQFLPQIFRFKE